MSKTFKDKKVRRNSENNNEPATYDFQVWRALACQWSARV
jgi:hypothetical protein